MRPIKFRAWNIKDKRMFQLDSLVFDSYSENLIGIVELVNFGIGEIDGKDFLRKEKHQWKFSEVELMQFTGLLDKNGKEIFEGDIVRYDNEKNCLVRWSEIQARFVMDKINGGKIIESFYNFNEVIAQDLEIIGNIYENPELLTQKGES